MKKLLLLPLLFVGVFAFGQNVRYDSPFPSISSQTSTPYLVANVPPNSPVISVCSSPANQVPCTNYATTYTSTGSACANGAQDTPQPQPSACQATGDAQGNIGFWAPPGTYDYTVTVGDTSFGPYTITLSSGLPVFGTGAKVVTTNLNSTTPGDAAGWLSGNILGDIGVQLTGSPVATQVVTQPYAGGRTSLDANVTNQVVHINPVANAVGPNWIQVPSIPATISVGSNTVTLSPCPLGIPSVLTNLDIMVYIDLVGTPEAAEITASTCTSGAASGTITFTAVNSHSAGYRIGSASFGITEAVQYAKSLYTGLGSTPQGGVVIMPPDLSPTINGTAFIQSHKVIVDFQNAVLQCNTPSAPCIVTGKTSNVNAWKNVTLENVSVRTVAAAIVSIEDSAFPTTIINYTAKNSGTGTFYPAHIQVDNDQRAVIDGVDIASLSNSECTSLTHCTAGILMTAGGNSGVLHASNLNMNDVNCVDNFAGNTLYIDGLICQNIPLFGVRSRSSFADNWNLYLNGTYQEGFTNKIGLGGAGLILEGGQSKISVSNCCGGRLPQYANTGATPFYFWVVAKDGSGNPTVPMMAGYASLTTSGTYDVFWPDVGATTYDVVRWQFTGVGFASPSSPTTNSCTGTTVNACGSIATGLVGASVCTSGVCHFTDDITVATSAYTVGNAGSYAPAISYWPGEVIATTTGAGSNPSAGARVMFDTILPQSSVTVGGLINPLGASSSSFVALRCQQNDWSMTGIICLSYPYSTPGALWLRGQVNGQSGQAGAINFAVQPGVGLASTDLITIKPSDQQLVFATGMLRPTWQANDSAIGYETAGSGGTYLRDSNSVRLYLGKVPDNAPQFKLTTSGLNLSALSGSGTKCVHADNTGQLLLAGSDCGSSTGATISGSPASGNLTKFSSGSAITNGDLSGDVTTSGTLATTVVKVNGSSLPTSAVFVGTDGSGKIQVQKNRRLIGYTFGDPAGSALSTSTVGYVVSPVACTIVGWDMLVDTGTATVTTWKLATGTAIPTVSNSISTSGVAISTGTAIHSTTVSDFTTTTVTANDIFAFNISAVSGAHYLYFDLQCDQ